MAKVKNLLFIYEAKKSSLKPVKECPFGIVFIISPAHYTERTLLASCSSTSYLALW